MSTNQLPNRMSESIDTDKLIDAVKKLSTLLRQERIKVFKDDIKIKMLFTEIGRLKGIIEDNNTASKNYADMSTNFNDVLAWANKGMQAELNVSDATVEKLIADFSISMKNIRATH